ncbi:hypothetical protein [Streptomyces sp. HPF1205]|uniref:hypothetical protein n=1 Tax=Streptomyces sp. HPF1205 TaxID=2873262 RepID=UPI001CEC23AB|nr:hypothetical protein [Streptomyces sp. HPF1205]
MARQRHRAFGDRPAPADRHGDRPADRGPGHGGGQDGGHGRGHDRGRPAPGDGPSGTVGRRTLLLGAALCCAGCSGGGTHPAPTASPATHSPAGRPSSGPLPPLPAAAPWRPGPGELQPAAKLAAVEAVEALGTWRPGQAGPAHAAARLTALGVPAARAARLARQTGSLAPAADEAVVQVIDAQYGGLLSGSASVLVVCAQTTRTGGTIGHGGTTVDVRLVRGAGGWQVTALHPAVPGPPVAPGALARAVLGDSRIQLPPASVADVRSGRVHDSVLRAMTVLAGTYRMSVSVVRSGHPLDVFGTTRPSDHPRGRAFDVWRIDGRQVVDPATPRSLIAAFMRAAAAAGSYNVGGPVPLSGPGDQFFSDATHHDHVHMGFLS